AQFLFVDFDLFAQCTHFFNRDDHREHNAQFTESRGTQDSAELIAQDLFTIHRDTDSAPAEERVLFFREVHVWQLFVAADVHGTNDNRLRATRFSHCFVSSKLFFFSGQRVAVHEQELSTIQTNAFSAVTLCTFNVTNRTNVSAHFYLVTVQRNSRSEEHTSELQSRFDLVCRLLLEYK